MKVPTLREVRSFLKYHLFARPATHPVPETELGIRPLAFDIDRYYDELRARASVTELDHVDYLGVRYPICLVRATGADPARRLVVIAGIHGNEHAGLLAIPRFLDDAAAWAGADLWIVAPANPVGAARNSRYNAAGYDVNRDFRRFATVEARAICGVIERARPDAIASLHEGPQEEGAFVFANRAVEPALARAVLAHLRARGTRLAAIDYFGRTLADPGYAPSGLLGDALELLWDRVLGLKATSGWAGDRGIPELTLESPWRSADGDARIAAHVHLLEALCAAPLRRYAAGVERPARARGRRVYRSRGAPSLQDRRQKTCARAATAL